MANAMVDLGFSPTVAHVSSVLASSEKLDVDLTAETVELLVRCGMDLAEELKFAPETVFWRQGQWAAKNHKRSWVVERWILTEAPGWLMFNDYVQQQVAVTPPAIVATSQDFAWLRHALSMLRDQPYTRGLPKLRRIMPSQGPASTRSLPWTRKAMSHPGMPRWAKEMCVITSCEGRPSSIPDTHTHTHTHYTRRHHATSTLTPAYRQTYTKHAHPAPRTLP